MNEIQLETCYISCLHAFVRCSTDNIGLCICTRIEASAYIVLCVFVVILVVSIATSIVSDRQLSELTVEQ